MTVTTFSELELDESLLNALESKGFTRPTAIQAAAIPPALEGRDVLGSAPTGTGKTAAYLLPVLQHLLDFPRKKSGPPRILILTPTRELAMQVADHARELAANTHLDIATITGGVAYMNHAEVFSENQDIVVATTGRLLQYIKEENFDCRAVETLILDEADRMYDLGFIKDIRWLFRRMPPANQRLNMLFSATLSYRVRELAFEQMNNAEYVEVEPEQKTGHRIKEELFYPSNEEKMRLLQTLIEEEWPDRAIIFANTKHRCEDIWGHLAADGHRVGLLTGDVAQKKRLRILEEFTRGDLDILVATDVAARGLHIPAVTHVFNYDLPDDCEDYVHRIGRTGRAGASGHSISLACEEYALNLPAIETYIGHSIPQSKYNPEALLSELPPPKRLTRPRSGNGPRRSGGAPRNRRRSG